ncbi:MAG TPA: choice-of-anchor B family protein, partial [Flavobacteriales bacterium]|nr:choice-of-anchor B family protein [Flavobacteriales bacterium]
MKKLLTLLLICLTFLANAQSSWNMNLLGTYDYPTTQGNDIWGWVDASQNEFAIVGLRNGISCVNVTNPSAPFEEFFINDVYSIWRDIKTYGNYAYVTTESDTGLLIIDLTDMTGNTFWHVKDFMNPITGINLHWEAAHDLFIDENGVCYIFGASNPNSFPAPPSSVIFLDVITNPTNPIHLGQWIDPQLTTMTNYVHDGMVRGDTMYTGNIYSGKVFIIDVSDKASPVTLGSATTPNSFTHNAWVSDNGNYVFTTDEKPDAYLAAFDISNLNNIQEVDRIQSNPGSNSIPHNTFVDGNFLITSYYTDGTTVHDITYPNNMIQVAYYDSYSGSGPGYNGCWGTYPYLPSGNIISSDVNSGAGGKGRLLIYGRNFQQASFLSGTVTNSNTGFSISNTTIQIVSTSYTTTTNLLGGYSLGSVNSGIFQVLFSAPGYIPIILNVTLSSGNMIILDAALSPGSGLPGCTDTSAVNYDPNATIDDGNCIYCNGTWVSLNMFDTYGDGWNGNTWTATSTTGGASYGPYTISNGSSGVESFCLPDDCYDIVCGNGTWQTEVSWTLTDPTGGILLSGGAPISIQYAIGLTCAVYGCMDSTALNYYAGANVDDGTCLYVPGCMDATACNYDPLADVDDGTCEWTSCTGVCANATPTGLNTTNVVQNRATINWDNMNDANCMVDQYRIKFRAVGSSTFTQKTMGQPVNS